MVYLGIDVGTTGSKATAIDLDGNIRAYAYREYKAVRTGAGYAEIDPHEVWQTVKYVISSAAADAGAPVKAIAVASLGESFVALGKNDNILRNSILYSDIRGAEETGEILGRFSEKELYEITGMPINSMYSLNKLLWIKKHEPNIFESIDKLLFYEDFIYYMLSGERCVDYSLASRTLLYNFTKRSWDDKILGEFGIENSVLSRLVPTGSVIGNISGAIASELNLPEGALLVAGAHDQVCAALGAGVLSKGECVDGIGTSECITTILGGLDQKEYMRKYHFCIEPYALEDAYVTLAFSSTGASVLGWFTDVYAAREKAECGKAVYKLLEDECPELPTDLFVLPHFAGSGTPYMDPFSTGAVLGLRLNTKRGDIYKACIEGLCFEMMVNAELLRSIGTSITDITCVGGGSRSDVLMQVKADIMDIPVRRLKVEESGTMALAMLCAAACSDYKDIKEAAGAMVKTDISFYPRPRHSGIYKERINTYRKIYSRIAELKN